MQVSILDNAAGSPGVGGSGIGAAPGGLVGQVGGIHLHDIGSISYATITGNAAAQAANLSGDPAVQVSRSIVGEPVGGANCSGPFASGGRNLTDIAGCGFTEPTDAVSADLGLGAAVLEGTMLRYPLRGGAVDGFIAEADCVLAGLSHAAFHDQRDEPRAYGDCEIGAVELPPAGSSQFVPLPPQRVFDTRDGDSPSGFVGAGQTITVEFTGAAGVPDTGVSAVAFNLTIDASGGAGFVTAHPGGGALPLASNLNTVRSGQTVPNLVVVPVGSDGTVSFYTQSGGHLLADIAGYYTEVPVARGGRTIPLDPARLFDTRDGGPDAFVPAGGEIAVPVHGVAGIPLSGVAAVILNLTGTDAVDAGYVTAYPGGTDRPLASNLNLAGPGHTAPNLVIVPVGGDGTVRFFTQSGAHLLADVAGYVTDSSAPLASEGLMVPLDPARMFDTRDGAAPSGFVGAGSTTVAAARGVAGVPEHAGGVVANLTATEAAGPGYVTAWPEMVAMPTASVLNLTEVGETRANASILPTPQGGDIAYFTQSGAHLLGDAFGYLLADPEVVQPG